jgi:broad specificity phosphatase PhoE
MATYVMLIRHAESLWNAAGRWQGHGDPVLSPRGVVQAESLAASLADQPPDRLIASDLRRARQTAAELARAWSIPCELDARLRELDIGAWTGLSRAEIERKDAAGLARFDAGDPLHRAGGAESRREIRARARAFIEELSASNPGDRVALVTHLGFVRALIPDAEPANTEVVGLRTGELLKRRSNETGEPAPSGPL